MFKTQRIFRGNKLVFLLPALFLCFTLKAQIASRGTATTATTTNNSLVIAKPAGVVQGDIMLVNIAALGSSSAATSSGWTTIRTSLLTSSPRRYISVLYKIAGASEPASYSFSMGSGTTSGSGAILAFSGVDPVTPFDVSATSVRSTTSTSVSTNSLSTRRVNSAIIFLGQAIGSAGGSSITWNNTSFTTTSPGALTELYDNQETTGRTSVAAAWAIKPGIGSTGTGRATITTSVRNSAILVALRSYDLIAPTVNATVPAANATGVSTTNNITATFSEPLSSSSVSSTTAFLELGTTKISASVSYSSSSQTITINPSSTLVSGTIYKVTLKGGASGIKDLAGNPMAADYTWNFTTTGTDVTRPTVVSTSPASNAVNVSLSSAVTATFSEALGAASVTGTNVFLQAGTVLVSATVAYTAGSTSLTLTPNAPLNPATVYTVTLKGGSTGIKDVAGNALAADYIWSFTTNNVDLIPPAVFSTIPVSNALDVPLSATITTTFNEPLSVASVTPTNISLKAGETTVPAALSYTAGSTSVTLTPTAPLIPNTVYTVTILGGATGIKDVAGNPLAADYSWSFTSQAADIVAPTVNSTQPIAGATNVPRSTEISAAFSEALNSASVNATTVFLKLGTTGIPVTVNYTPGSTTVSLVPLELLFPGSVYTVTLLGGASGIRDVANNPLAADYSWSFTTAAADQTPPTVISTTPASNATNVSTSTAVSAIFSEVLNGATLDGSTVFMQAGSTTVPATVSYTPGSTIVNLVPSSALAAETQYTVTLKGGATGIKDVSANALVADYTWTFTTATAPVAGGNDIVSENALPGNPPAEWDVPASGDPTIQGFATEMSVNRGTTVRFKINVTGSGTDYNIKIYRLGYYNGNGARLVADLGTFTGITQPPPTTNEVIGLVDYGTWSESASWAVPSSAVSGIYIAKLTRASNGGASHIVFVVRNDASTAPILFKTSDATWQAYNSYGGYSFYGGSTANVTGRADKVSYNRPFNTRSVKPENFVFNAEYPMLRWMERNGYHMTYATDVDMERNTSPITPSKYQVMLSVGHDEYWSLNMRNNYENARNAGVHLAFFSGNEVYWKTRWENNTRTLVCYKEGASTGQGEYNCGGNCDPAIGVWTGLWRFGCEYGEDGCRPENALSGQLSWTESAHALEVPYEFRNLPFWRNTTVASLQPGQIATLGMSILGYEWNYEQPAFAGFNPPGRITMSSTTKGGLNHRISLYRHTSGAIVFGAGTVQWSWGLDDKHDRDATTSSRDLQQATLNLLTDMGVTPGTKQSDLTLSAPVIDQAAPVSVISTPVNGTEVTGNTPVNITGTASDIYGINRVEISVDGGLTWQTAAGTTNWSYTWTAQGSGSVVIKTRAIDNNGNAETPGTAPAANAVTINVTGGTPGACPCSIFTNQVPLVVNRQDNTVGIVLGTRFRASTNGFITGLRFYKGVGNTGTHIGQLWTSSGTLLTQATYTNETASGWQQVSLQAPVAITAGVDYIVSYHSSEGYYSTTANFFTSNVVNGPLTAPADATGANNGLYLYSATPVFPNQSYQAATYFVDVVFNADLAPDQAAPTVLATTPVSNATNVALASVVTAQFSEALDPASVNGTNAYIRNGAVSIPATLNYTSGSQHLITLTPSSALSNNTQYTVTLRGGTTGIKDLAGNPLASDYTWSFTTLNLASDLTPPVSTISSPLNGVTVTVNQPVTINGTASDAGGVNRVEVSVNGGSSWQTATGTTSWTLSWTPTTAGTYTILSRAVDNAGNTETSGTVPAANAISVIVSTTANPCPCTVFNASQPIQPTTSNSKNDGSALNLGMKFIPSQSGFITALRFYKSPTNAGTHTGMLHTAAGTLLAQAVFVNETASGWQQVNLTTPVPVTAGSTYVVSYHSSPGNYSSTEGFFETSLVNGPLTAPSSASSGGNGLYLYGGAPAMPVSTYNASNYWVDVVFNTSISSGARISTPESMLQDSQEATGRIRPGARGTLAFGLGQNAPNPSNGFTTIRYSMPVRTRVTLSLYDMQGRLVRVLTQGVKEAGEHSLQLDTRNLGKGMYFYTMSADGFSSSKRLIVE
jgi:hypothetical protein